MGTTEKDGDTVLFIFDGGQLAPEQHSAIRFPDGELSRYEYVSAGDLGQYTIGRLVRHITAAVEARSAGLPIYLENGEVPRHG